MSKFSAFKVSEPSLSGISLQREALGIRGFRDVVFSSFWSLFAHRCKKKLKKRDNYLQLAGFVFDRVQYLVLLVGINVNFEFSQDSSMDLSRNIGLSIFIVLQVINFMFFILLLTWETWDESRFCSGPLEILSATGYCLSIFHGVFLSVALDDITCSQKFLWSRIIHSVSSGGVEGSCFSFGNTFLWILIVLSAIILCICLVLLAALGFDYRPESPSIVARPVGQPEMLYRLSCIGLALGSAFIKPSSLFLLLLRAGLALVNLLLFYDRLPFYSPGVNVLNLVFFSGGLLASIPPVLFHYLKSSHLLFRASWIFEPSVLLALGVLLGPILFFRRRRQILAISTASELCEEKLRAEEVELCCRFSFAEKKDESCVDAFYEAALETFPSSAQLLSCYGVWLLERKGNTPLCMLQLKKAADQPKTLDISYVLSALYREIKEQQAAQGEESLEVQRLMQAARLYEIRTKVRVREFWTTMMDDVPNTNRLATIIASIERAKTTARAIYLSLLRTVPKSAKVLRSYARFLQEIAEEESEAARVGQLAEHAEEAHRREKQMYANARRGRVAKDGGWTRSRAGSSSTDGGRDAESMRGDSFGQSHMSRPCSIPEQSVHDPGLALPDQDSQDPNPDPPFSDIGDSVLSCATTTRGRPNGAASMLLNAAQQSSESGATPPASVAWSFFPANARKKRNSIGERMEGVERNSETSSLTKGFADRRRKDNYRDRLLTGRSGALKQLAVATYRTMILLAVVSALTFVLCHVSLATYMERTQFINKPANLKRAVIHACLGARELVSGGDDFTGMEAETLLSHAVDRVATAVRQLYYDSHESSLPVRNAWQLPYLSVESYLHGPPAVTYHSNVSLLYALSYFTSNGRILSAFWAARNSSSSTFPELATRPEFQYMMSNGHRAILRGLDTVFEAYIQSVVSKLSMFGVYLAISFTVSLGVVIFVARQVCIPIFRKVVHERRTVLNFFLEIPKATVRELRDSVVVTDVAMMGVASNGGDEEEDPNMACMLLDDLELLDKSEHSSDAQRDTFKQLSSQFIRWACILLLVPLAVFALASAAFVVSKIHTTAGAHAAALTSLSSKLYFLANELIINDPVLWPDTGELYDRLATAVDAFGMHLEALKHSPGVWMWSQRQFSPQFNSLLFHPYCRNTDHATPSSLQNLHYVINFTAPSTNLSSMVNSALAVPLCTSLDTAAVQFLENCKKILHLPRHLVQAGGAAQILGNIREGARGAFMGSLDSLAVQMLQDSTAHARGVQSLNQLLLFAGVMVYALVFSFFRSLISQISAEHSRTVQMLLMMPNHVIDSVDAIRTFLATGEHDTILHQRLMESQQRTRNVLQAAVDPVIVCDSNGMVEIFNPAAERMFMWPLDEVEGKPVGNLLPALTDAMFAIARSQPDSTQVFSSVRETEARRKDGSGIAVSLSIGDGKLPGGKTFFVVFIRDMTERKRYEQLLQDEQRRSEQLLLNILPADVAERLKAGEHTIADAHDEVSIMFADIVAFTTMSAALCPAELVELLNEMFSQFDEIAARFKVQKVKTIGDSYMAATLSLAADVMVDFGLELLRSLHALNAQRGLNLQARIGINTGSVIAGVIGTRTISYDLWGDAVNVAQRMESYGIAGRVQVSQSTYDRIQYKFDFEEREELEIKGKGKMRAYLVIGRKRRENKVRSSDTESVVSARAGSPKSTLVGSGSGFAAGKNSVTSEDTPRLSPPLTSSSISQSENMSLGACL